MRDRRDTQNKNKEILNKKGARDGENILDRHRETGKDHTNEPRMSFWADFVALLQPLHTRYHATK